MKFMASLLLENACSKCRRGFVGLGPSMLCLVKMYLSWAEEIVPAEQCTVDFVATMLNCVRALMAINWQKEATALASRCLGFYRNVWGDDDKDTVFLSGLALKPSKMKKRSSFLDNFSWEVLPQDIRSTCITNNEGRPDDGRIAQCREELHQAFVSQIDPCQTYHLASCRPEFPVS